MTPTRVAKAAVATAAPEPADPPAAVADRCWLVVHELHDTSAAWLAQALGAVAPQGLHVKAMPVQALMTGWRWRLQVDSQGSGCRVEDTASVRFAGAYRPHARDTPRPGPLARADPAQRAKASHDLSPPRPFMLSGVINRCGPVALPAAVDDADYKSAEWSALLVAWLHGLPCPVLNRPRCTQPYSSNRSAAVWKQAAARAGMAIWPQQNRAPEPAWVGPAGPQDTLLVVGDRCFKARHGAHPAAVPDCAATERAAVAAAAACGCDVLAWQGRRDAQGTWRVIGASPWPDLRAFGAPVVAALAQRLLSAKGQT